MRQRTRHLVALGAVTALTAGSGLAAIGSAQAATVPKTAIGLSSNGKNLTVFSLTTGKRTKALGQAKGLSGDSRLIGIDERPANPAADRLRIISDTGQNLRHDVSQPGPTTAVDGALNYDGTVATGVTAAAYTNSDNDTTSGTTLFDLDTVRDQVVQQVPANSGNLLVSGRFGPRQGPVAGFDIVGSNSGTRTADNIGFASLRPTGGGLATLYRVNLLSGKFTKVAQFDKDIADIAIAQPR
jgi:hypothetical protein